MLGSKSIISIAFVLFLLLGIRSQADTFLVTNLNDPGAGSLRRAIENSNSNEGPDTIVFEEGLEGTIVLNLGVFSISDDLTINGPGGGIITIDADANSAILDINDGDEGKNSIVNISGLRFINGIAGTGSEIDNFENLTVNSCQFLNGNASGTGGAILNRKILTVDSCYFENNGAVTGGGAISNDAEDANLIVKNSYFINNHSSIGGGGAIANIGIIELITNCTFENNKVTNEDGNGGGGGAVQNFLGTVKEISHCTFENNTAVTGGAIFNTNGLTENIANNTFMDNRASSGSAILNDSVMNVSFTTIAFNTPIPPFTPPPPIQTQDLRVLESEPGGIETVGNGVTRIRNSIITSNIPNNCFGFHDDLGGNYSNDSSCGFTGDDAIIILGPLADNGGPTETMALLGGDPIDGATLNCDALNEMGNPTGIPIGIDQRFFPRPFGVRCDSGAFESQPTSSITITKVTDPAGGAGFDFDSTGFGSLQGCGLRGEGGNFGMNDGDSVNCIVPEGDYSIAEDIPSGYELIIFCLEAPDNLTINNGTGEIEFTIEGPGQDVDCVYTNTRTGRGNGGCSLAPVGANHTFPLYLFIPALIMVRRIVKKYRE